MHNTGFKTSNDSGTVPVRYRNLPIDEPNLIFEGLFLIPIICFTKHFRKLIFLWQKKYSIKNAFHRYDFRAIRFVVKVYIMTTLLSTFVYPVQHVYRSELLTSDNLV